jgi:magnesium-transporting ATPase (P-type)
MPSRHQKECMASAVSNYRTKFWIDLASFTRIKKETFGYILFLLFAFLIFFFPLFIYSNYFSTHNSVNAPLQHIITCIGALTSLSCVMFIGCFWYKNFRQSEDEAEPTFTLSFLIGEERIRTIMPVLLTLFFTLVLIGRTVNGECGEDSVRPMIDDWVCNPYSEIKMIPMDTALILMSIPLLSSSLLKEKSVLFLWISWFIVLAGLVISAVITNSEKSTPIIVCYTMGSFMMLRENMDLQNALEEMITKVKAKIEEDNLGMKEKELRGMIANVAHDLKTVSFFSNFVLFISQALTLVFFLSLIATFFIHDWN